LNMDTHGPHLSTHTETPLSLFLSPRAFRATSPPFSYITHPSTHNPTHQQKKKQKKKKQERRRLSRSSL
jgi:hypothetical protein